MKTTLILTIGLTFILWSCNTTSKSNSNIGTDEIGIINELMDDWHAAAARADYEAYLGAMDSTAIYIGTDATEYWDKETFGAFCKPYFDQGKGWEFTALSRNVYFNNDGSVAWFDEVLNGHMGICRGSGVLEFQGNFWKLKQYVLSAAIPNEIMGQVVEDKANWDSTFVTK